MYLLKYAAHILVTKVQDFCCQKNKDTDIKIIMNEKYITFFVLKKKKKSLLVVLPERVQLKTASA